MKNKLLVLNMKMYMEPSRVKGFIESVEDSGNVIICPEAIYIPCFINKYKNIGIQNVCHKLEGAYTGCNSALHAKKLGAGYAIVGHSECRKYLNITDELNSKKIKSEMVSKYYVNDISMANVPSIMVFEDGVLKFIYDIKDNGYDIENIKLFVNGIIFSKEEDGIDG